jgi:hypothetical protein
MSAAIRPYSMAMAPVSSRTNRDANLNIWPALCACVRRPDIYQAFS